MVRAFAAGLAIALLIGGGVVAWKTWEHIRQMEASLEESRRANAAARETLARYADRLNQTAAAAGAAQQRAASAETRAGAAETRAGEAEARAGQAEAGRQRAEGEAQRSRAELEDLKQRRAAELDRMYQALSKVANTRRTTSGMVVELANDSFFYDFDKATLRPENREILSRIAGVLLASSGYRLFVYGHTDDVGTPAYNQQLSQRRAEGIAAYLRDAGVPAAVMEVKGFGASSPRAPGRDTASRQKNRRVEIGIVDTVIHYEGQPR